MNGFFIGEVIGFTLSAVFTIWLLVYINRKVTKALESYWNKKMENKK